MNLAWDQDPQRVRPSSSDHVHRGSRQRVFSANSASSKRTVATAAALFSHRSKSSVQLQCGRLVAESDSSAPEQVPTQPQQRIRPQTSQKERSSQPARRCKLGRPSSTQGDRRSGSAKAPRQRPQSSMAGRLESQSMPSAAGLFTKRGLPDRGGLPDPRAVAIGNNNKCRDDKGAWSNWWNAAGSELFGDQRARPSRAQSAPRRSSGPLVAGAEAEAAEPPEQESDRAHKDWELEADELVEEITCVQPQLRKMTQPEQLSKELQRCQEELAAAKQAQRNAEAQKADLSNQVRELQRRNRKLQSAQEPQRKSTELQDKAKERGAELMKKLGLRNAKLTEELERAQAELQAARKVGKEEKEAKELAHTSKDISESILSMKVDKISRLQAEIESNSAVLLSSKIRVQEAEAAAELGAKETLEAQARCASAEAQARSVMAELKRVQSSVDQIQLQLRTSNSANEAKSACIAALENQKLELERLHLAKIAKQETEMQRNLSQLRAEAQEAEATAAQKLGELLASHQRERDEAARKLSCEVGAHAQTRHDKDQSIQEKDQTIVTQNQTITLLQDEIAALKEQLRVAMTPVITSTVPLKKLDPRPRWSNPGIHPAF